MRIKWDSNVARDIAVELERQEQEIGDCIAELRQCTDILRQMQSGEMSRTIEKYVAAAEELEKGLRRIGEESGRTGRNVTRADEMFEAAEARMKGRAEGMEDRARADVPATGSGGYGPAYDGWRVHPAVPPIMQRVIAPPPSWPGFNAIRRTVIIDQFTNNAGVVIPQWLSGIIGGR